MGGVFGLDYGAVMMMGAALGADTALLAEVLPDVEQELIAAIRDQADDDCEDDLPS